MSKDRKPLKSFNNFAKLMVILLFSCTFWFRSCEKEKPTTSPPSTVVIPRYKPDTSKIKRDTSYNWGLKGDLWKEDDSLRRLYDPNHPDFDWDPNDLNRIEWEGYYH